MSWTKLGLNIQEEWIEENETGQRRVQTASGPLSEPSYLDLRWGRVSSSSDAFLVATALSHAHIFQSYASLDRASAVWSSPVGPVPQTVSPSAAKPFKILIEQAMARRVWSAVSSNRWSTSLPDWNGALRRKGMFDWPLFVDIGITKHITSTWLPLEEYIQWVKSELAQKKLKIEYAPPQVPTQINQVRVEQWIITHPHLTSFKTAQTIKQWAGDQPQLSSEDVWQDAYAPFSSLSGEGSGYVDPLLNQALHRARPTLEAQKVRASISQSLGCQPEDLSLLLSDDQIDAVWLALEQLKNKQSFLLADETGYGKGRILAALAKIGLNTGHKILFFTEKKTLFSDFYRDCHAVFDLNNNPQNWIDPVVLHNTARVLNEKGELVVPKKNLRLPVPEDVWTWTTYSQFNRNNVEKIDELVAWMKKGKTWVLMDEAQNAAGSSNTSKAIKKIQKASQGVLFSSATFAKNEEQLRAYEALFDGDSQEWMRLLSAFVADTDTLRTAITLMWAEKGVFLRREHPPMALPEPLWIKQDTHLLQQHKDFSLWWSLMLQCSSFWNKSLFRNEGPWAKIGGHLSRASREFSLLQKKDFLVDEVVASIQEGQKSVVVADWTLSSHVARLVAKEKDAEEVFEDKEQDVSVDSQGVVLSKYPLWKDSWCQIVSDIFSDDDLMRVTGPAGTQMKNLRDQVIHQIQKLPNWGISPFDDVIEDLRKKGIRVGEISGRSWVLSQDKDTWVIKSRSEENRTKTVQAFNAGEFDCMLLTRAGNSGLSLHASAKFKDQKQRHLKEWDVAPDASVRLQFWGRVRRKDQVNEPQRSTLLVDTPFERRRLHRDTVKQKKIISHGGTMHDQDLTWIGPEGNAVTKEWLGLHRQARGVLGAWPESHVEKVLTRSLVLSDNDQHHLLMHLQQGVHLMKDWNSSRLPQWQGESRQVRSMWWWGSGEHALNWEQRLWAPRPTAHPDQVAAELQKHIGGTSETSSEVMKHWKSDWDQWWSAYPHEKNNPRQQCLQWWLNNASKFERGQGVEINDPHVGERSRAIVLGWSAPQGSDPARWAPSQIAIHLWLVTMDRPLTLSLMAFLDSSFGGAVSIASRPQMSWFSIKTVPTHSLVLVGPAWSVAAWGARYSPQGQLLHLHDESGQWLWGWKMPASWGWNTMMATDRELANIQHLFAFYKAHPYETCVWRWNAQTMISATAQPGGVMLSGMPSDLEQIAFPVLQKHGPIKWSQDKSEWFLLINWRDIKGVFASWFASGAIPTVSSKFALWHKNSWKALLKK